MSRCPIIALTGVSLFILAPYLLHKRRNASSKAVHGKYSNDIKYSKSNIHELISSMEVLIQADEGGRGINEIMPPAGELYNSALEIMSAKNVAIITGFPCMIDYDPPTETDGPLGALAIAKCLLMLGKDVVLATDECNEEVLLACAAASAAHKSSLSSVVRTGILTMESFPAQISFTPKEDQRLQELAQSVDLVIAIERAGPCKDGRYLTMRARDMSNIVAPLDLLIMPPGLRDGEDDADAPVEPKNWGKPPRSIGIGDGGNEVGMGKVYSKVISSSILNAAEIACVVPADHLIVTSVSNWGGYALAAAAAAVALVHNVNYCSGHTGAAGKDDGFSAEQVAAQIAQFLPSPEEETHKCKAIVGAGARDGVTGKLDLYIDGMPLETSLDTLHRLRNLPFLPK